MEYTQGATSPEIFRKWAAIALVGGALERRVWISNGRHTTFANLYTMLVAPPGVGKYVIEDIRELWQGAADALLGTSMFRVAPDSMTKASLMDALARAKVRTPHHLGEALKHHSLLIAAEEFSVLLPSYDLEYIGALNSIYNNKRLHEEHRRTGLVKELKIDNPQLNIFGGAQPGWLASVFPEEAWSTGLTSRMIMVYSTDTPNLSLFFEPPDASKAKNLIVSGLEHLADMYGEAKFTSAAAHKIDSWKLSGGKPEPTHSKLEHYNRRRPLHALKLCLISAVARTGKLFISTEDVERALGWLFEAEASMPDIFRAMVGRSDSQIIEELHHYALGLWKTSGGKPIEEKRLFAFLSLRLPSDKVGKLIEVAERSGYIERIAGEQTYKPKPRGSTFGLE